MKARQLTNGSLSGSRKHVMGTVFRCSWLSGLRQLRRAKLVAASLALRIIKLAPCIVADTLMAADRLQRCGDPRPLACSA
jgi:hypothetical protein